MGEPTITVTASERPDLAEVAVAGVLDATSGPRIVDRVRPLLDDERSVALDISGVSRGFDDVRLRRSAQTGLAGSFL